MNARRSRGAERATSEDRRVTAESGVKGRVLLADDEAAVRRATRQVLCSGGFEVDTVGLGTMSGHPLEAAATTPK